MQDCRGYEIHDGDQIRRLYAGTPLECVCKVLADDARMLADAKRAGTIHLVPPIEIYHA